MTNVYDFVDQNLQKPIPESPSGLVYDSVEQTQSQSVNLGYIQAGADTTNYAVDPSQGQWMGAPKFADAPFSVDMEGNLVAASVNLNGVALAGFGGSGADGALDISSGTTTLDLANAAVVTKNYSSISITGTGALAFSNPNTKGTVVILKSQEGVTITSSATRAIDLRSIGAAGGLGGTTAAEVGADGTESGELFTMGSNANNTLVSGEGSGSGAGGIQVTSGVSRYSRTAASISYSRSVLVLTGSGGGGGGAGDSGSFSAGGNGGRGAGALLIECGGAYNVTGTIDLSGTAGADSAPGNPGGGGGGGGSGGMAVFLYNTLTTDSGTYTVSAGAGGAGNGGVAGVGGDGGGGAGSTEGAGTNGGLNAGSVGGNGGAGSAGTAVRMLNNFML